MKDEKISQEFRLEYIKEIKNYFNKGIYQNDFSL